MEIIKELMQSQIDKFIQDYQEASRKLFYSEEKNKLIHPGEFGMQRERILIRFIEKFIPKEYGVGTGFIVNSEGEVSNQSDIVIYSKSYTPLFEDAADARFFTSETCVAVGEVKSILNKSNLEDALLKLSKAKKIRSNIKNPNILKSRYKDNYKPLIRPYDQVITFLVCERLEFNREEFFEIINNIYNKNSIDSVNKPNMILSLEDGLFTYFIQNNDKTTCTIHYPTLENNELKMLRVGEDKYNYIKLFMSYIYQAIVDTTILFPDLTIYMGGSENEKLEFES